MNQISRPASGGFKRIILLPFMIIILTGFLFSWGLYLAGSRQAVRDLVNRVASDTARTTADNLTAYLDRVWTHASVNASHFTHRGGGTDSTDYRGMFLDQLKEYEEIAIIAVGFSNGEYFEAQRLESGTLRVAHAGKATGGALQFFSLGAGDIPVPAEKLPDYDPRKRPWYMNARNAGRQVWSDIYSLYSSSEPAISATVPFNSPSGPGGVVSTDVTLSRLSDLLASYVDSSTGVVTVTDSKGELVASSIRRDGSGGAGFPLDKVFSAIPGDNGGDGRAVSFELLLPDGKYLGTHLRLRREGLPEWDITVVLREQAFTARLLQADRETLALLILLLGIFFLIGTLVVGRVTGPLRALQEAVAGFDPAAPESTGVLETLSLKRNEIGSLAENFLKMQRRIGDDYNALRGSLNEKELLLKEVHHRVKNNLQIVSSMLCLQANAISDPADRQVIMQCQDRVQAMAYVHENAYASGQFSGIHMESYFRQIAESLRQRDHDAEIIIEVEPAGLSLPLDSAIPCGLIVNELVTNAFKYAFTGGENEAIRIRLVESGRRYLLSVEDNGRGASLAEAAAGLGTDLVQALSSQLGGSVARSGSEGFRVLIDFPVV